MSLDTNIRNAFTNAATVDKLLKTLINGNAADLSALTTTNKSNLVAAINELAAAVGGAGASIVDTGTSGSSVWSSSKTNTEIVGQIATAVAALINSAPGTLNTLDEIAAALADDPNFAATITTALGNRVRTDTAAQGLDSTQQSNARTNIAAASSAAVGPTDTDYVALFNAALV